MLLEGKFKQNKKAPLHSELEDPIAGANLCVNRTTYCYKQGDWLYKYKKN